MRGALFAQCAACLLKQSLLHSLEFWNEGRGAAAPVRIIADRRLPHFSARGRQGGAQGFPAGIRNGGAKAPVRMEF